MLPKENEITVITPVKSYKPWPSDLRPGDTIVDSSGPSEVVMTSPGLYVRYEDGLEVGLGGINGDKEPSLVIQTRPTGIQETD
ncbi:hypothetical protein ACFLZP_01245 [Patescibacteria group bacterium]